MSYEEEGRRSFSGSDEERAPAPRKSKASSKKKKAAKAPAPVFEESAPAPAASKAEPTPVAAAAAAATITVIVKAPSGKAFPVTLPATATLGDLARKCAAEPSVGAPAPRLLFSKGGKPLDGNFTPLAELGVGNEATLQLRVSEPVRGPEFELMCKLPSGRTVSLSVASTDDVSALRAKVAAAESCRPAAVTLTYRSAELRDGTSCEDAGLSRECIVKAAIRELPPEPAAAAAAPSAGTQLSDAERQEALANFAASAAGKKVEVVFAFDTTGSMYSCLEAVRTNIEGTVRRLMQEIEGIRIGILAVGDYCDASSKYVVEQCDLSDKPDKICKFVRTVKSTGGGDLPEAYELALQKARSLSWTEGSSRALVMIGDSPPHPPSYTTEAIWWKDELDALAEMGVKVYGIQALNQSESTAFYREMATRTGAIYLRFANFALITDMFLAVCMRESTPQKLAEFTETVREEGRMTTETAEMLETLARPNEEKKKDDEEKEKEKPPKYPYEWWDRRNDHGHTQYTLKDGKWISYSGGSSSSSSSRTFSSSTAPSSRRAAEPSSSSSSSSSSSGPAPSPAPKKKDGCIVC